MAVTLVQGATTTDLDSCCRGLPAAPPALAPSTVVCSQHSSQTGPSNQKSACYSFAQNYRGFSSPQSKGQNSYMATKTLHDTVLRDFSGDLPLSPSPHYPPHPGVFTPAPIASLFILAQELYAFLLGFSVWNVPPPNHPSRGLLPHLFQVFALVPSQCGLP